MKSEIKIEAVAADSDRFVFKVLGFQLACYIVMWNEAYRLLHVMCSKILGCKTPNIKYKLKCTETCLLGAARKVQWEESNVWKAENWAKRLEDETQRFGEESESSNGNDISQNNET